jgi:hypothetical protein
MLRIVAFKTRRDNRKYRNREFVNSGGRELSAAAARASADPRSPSMDYEWIRGA